MDKNISSLSYTLRASKNWRHGSSEPDQVCQAFLFILHLRKGWTMLNDTLRNTLGSACIDERDCMDKI